MIRRLIRDGRFEDGHLPPENVLAASLGVSRTTVRTALQSLQHEGLVTRRRGIGTLVNTASAPWRIGLHRLVGFSTLLSELGHTPTVDIECRTVAELPEKWAQRLGVPTRSECLVMDKLFRADSRPAIAITDYVPRASLRALPSLDDIPDAIFDFFSQYGENPVEYAIAEIVPRVADEPIATRLALQPGEPLLSLLEVHYTVDNEPLGISSIDVNDHNVRFNIVRRR